MVKKIMRKWLGIDESEKRAGDAAMEARSAKVRVDRHIEELERFTTLDVDAHVRGNCTIILTGVYKGRAYIQFYDLPTDYFREYVERLKYERGEGIVRNVDAPHGFRGYFDI